MKLCTYKMRAEAPVDFTRAWTTIAMQTWTVTGGNSIGTGDCEIVFRSKWSLAHIKRVLELITDGHVMAETVAYLDEYTGQR